MLTFIRAAAGPLLLGGVLFYLLMFGGITPDVVEQPEERHPAIITR